MSSYLRQTYLQILFYWFTLRERDYRRNCQPRVQKGIKLELCGVMRLKIEIGDKDCWMKVFMWHVIKGISNHIMLLWFIYDAVFDTQQRDDENLF